MLLWEHTCGNTHTLLTATTHPKMSPPGEELCGFLHITDSKGVEENPRVQDNED